MLFGVPAGSKGLPTARIQLHSNVAVEVDRLHAAGRGLEANITRIFGSENGPVSDEPVTVIRQRHWRREHKKQRLRRRQRRKAATAAAASASDAAGSRKPRPAVIDAGPAAELPKDFDWRAYLQHHPDIAQKVSTEAAAAEHYRQHGARQRLLCSRLRVKLRYTGAQWAGA